MSEISQEELERYEELQLMSLDCAREGEVPTLLSMIEHGLSPNTCDHKGNTLLMLSCYNGNFECSKMLIEMGADLNSKNDHGHSIIAGVAFKGYIEIVKLLVENGAKIETHPMKNPIVFASMFGRVEVVKYLQSVQNRDSKTSSKLSLVFAEFVSFFRKKR